MFWTSPVVDTLHWGPEPGTVQWSFNDHALHWSTSRLSLDLIRGSLSDMCQNVSTDDGAQPNQQWDNLRGARFEATLDGSWHVRKPRRTCLPGAGRCCHDDGHGLAGWGRQGVVRWACRCGTCTGGLPRIQGLGDQDTLFWTAAYAPFHWGNMPSPLSFASTAASLERRPRLTPRPIRIGLHAEGGQVRNEVSSAGPRRACFDNLMW